MDLVRRTVAFGGSSRRAVMAALADHATDEGYCYPGIDLLAAETELEEKTVRRSIKALQEAGWLTVHAKSVGALHRHSAYSLNIGKLKASKRVSRVDIKSAVTPDIKSGVESLSGQIVRCTADIDDQKGDSESAVLEPPLTPNRSNRSFRAGESVLEFDSGNRKSEISKPVLLKTNTPKPSGGTADSDLLRSAIREVHAHYVAKTGRTSRHTLTDARMALGLRRLNERLRVPGGTLSTATADMKGAIDTIVASEWHIGENPHGKKYLEWEDNLFKNQEQLERWINRRAEGADTLQATRPPTLLEKVERMGA